MLLNRDAIRQKQLIVGASDSAYHTASYNISIGKIVNHAGVEVEGTDLPPQGMVRVISRECLRLPTDVAGYAWVKTGLCDEGILAINIGIIDPGYHGFLSSTLINFGRNSYSLKVGDVFLRLTFHDIAALGSLEPMAPIPLEEYVRQKKQLVRRDFSPTFLNIEETAKTAAERVVGSWEGKALLWVSVFALLFTAASSLATNLSALTATRAYIQSDQERLKAEVKDLQVQVRDLQKQAVQRGGEPEPKSDPKSP